MSRVLTAPWQWVVVVVCKYSGRTSAYSTGRRRGSATPSLTQYMATAPKKVQPSWERLAERLQAEDPGVLGGGKGRGDDGGGDEYLQRLKKFTGRGSGIAFSHDEAMKQVHSSAFVPSCAFAIIWRER